MTCAAEVGEVRMASTTSAHRLGPRSLRSGRRHDDRATVAEGAQVHASRPRVLLTIRLLSRRCGGAERMYAELANGLASCGYPVHCVYCDAGEAPPFYDFAPAVSLKNLRGRRARRKAGYRLLDLLGRAYPAVPAAAPLAWLAKNLFFAVQLAAEVRRRRPDVVISFLPPANTVSLLVGLATGCKVIPTNHGVPELDYASEQRWDQNPVDRWLRLRLLRFAARIHVLSDAFVPWFSTQLQQRVVPIPNGVAADFRAPSSELERQPEVIAVGRLVPEKNHLVLLEAWSQIAHRHPHWRLRIFGDGPLREALERRIGEHDLRESVLLAGEDNHMEQVYSRASILCHPSLHEGFGLAVAEALACGVPVVAFSDCSGVKDLVRHGADGYLVERDGGAAGLAAALDHLISNHKERERMSRNALEGGRRFGVDRFVADWCSLINEVAT